MPWSLFWTCVAQIALAAFVLSIPVAFFVYMVGTQIKREVPVTRKHDPVHDSIRFVKS